MARAKLIDQLPEEVVNALKLVHTYLSDETIYEVPQELKDLLPKLEKVMDKYKIQHWARLR